MIGAIDRPGLQFPLAFISQLDGDYAGHDFNASLPQRSHYSQAFALSVKV